MIIEHHEKYKITQNDISNCIMVYNKLELLDDSKRGIFNISNGYFNDLWMPFFTFIRNDERTYNNLDSINNIIGIHKLYHIYYRVVIYERDLDLSFINNTNHIILFPSHYNIHDVIIELLDLLTINSEYINNNIYHCWYVKNNKKINITINNQPITHISKNFGYITCLESLYKQSDITYIGKYPIYPLSNNCLYVHYYSYIDNKEHIDVIPKSDKSILDISKSYSNKNIIIRKISKYIEKYNKHYKFIQ